nr:MAG TPA: hypothetical protein [Caudoviricetes sp.]
MSRFGRGVVLALYTSVQRKRHPIGVPLTNIL